MRKIEPQNASAVAEQRMTLMPQTGPILSPCVQTCRLDGEVCVGCGRTRAEIATWSRISDAERATVMERLWAA
jgi:predicted Fe-S protein YdhL (DUF1289 family)